MNTSKRLLSVLICLVMVLSMMATSFASAQTVTDATGDVAEPVVNNAAELTGANPTTDVAAPVIDENTIVVDADAKEDEEYILNWNGQEYGPMWTPEPTPDDPEPESYSWFEIGYNLATTIEDALALAKVMVDEEWVETPTILVKSNVTAETAKIFTRVKMYTEAYNTMPFVTGTAFDGSDWSENAEFTAKTADIGVLDVDVIENAHAGAVELYGFTYSGNIVINLNTISVPVDVTVYNSRYKLSSSKPAVAMASYANKSASEGRTFLMKNTYITGSAQYLFTGYCVSNFIVDGLYMTSKTMSGNADNNTSFKQDRLGSGINTKGVFKNMNLQNIGLDLIPQGYEKKNWYIGANDKSVSGYKTNEDLRVLSFENNTFHNAGTYNKNSAFYVANNYYSKTIITGNRVIMDTAKPFIAGTTYAERISLRVYNNYAKGTTLPDTLNATVATSTGFGNEIYDNYTDGKQYVLKSSKDTSKVTASDWYLDEGMSIKVSQFVKASDITVANGLAYANGFKVNAYIANGGSAADVAFAGKTLTWKDSTGATVAASDITSGTYTVTASAEIGGTTCSADYTVTVAADDGTHFANSFVDEAELIDAKKAIIVSNAFTQANLSTITAEWNGKSYTFVKGVNAFKTLDDATTYTNTNDITDAHYLILDIGGTKGDTPATFQPRMPGKYFTRNYNKKPYTKSDAATDPFGLEWKSNINTDNADSFNTADGITGKYVGFGTAHRGGDFELYGFAFALTIEMCSTSQTTRKSDKPINLSLINSYLKPTTEAFIASGEYDSVAGADAYNDSLTFKDSYLELTTKSDKSASYRGIFHGDEYPAKHITFDGVFADFTGTYTSTHAAYLHQLGAEYSFTIKNSNFRNGVMPLYIRGRYGKGADYRDKPESRVLNISDNIFYNFSLYTEDTFGDFHLGNFNKFVFDGNKIYSRKANTPLLNASDTTGDTHPDIIVSVKDNTLIGIKDSIGINRYHDKAKSEVGYNFLTSTRDDPADGVTATGEDFTVTNNSPQKANLYSEDYYLDYEKAVLSKQYVSALKFTVPGGGFYKDGLKATIYLSTGKTLADVETLSDDAVLTWANIDGSALDAATVTKESVGTGKNYKAKVTMGDIIITMNVTVLPNTITGYAASTYARNDKGLNVPTHPSAKTTLEDIPHLSGGFVDEAGLIDPSNAAFIDGDITYEAASGYYGKFIEGGKTLSSGDYKAMTWNGQQYIAVYNTNLFGTVENAYNKGKDEYLIGASEWGQYIGDYYGGKQSEYILRRPGKYFTPNYATNPYIKGDGEGNGWVSNIGTGEGQFNPDNSIKAGNITFKSSDKTDKQKEEAPPVSGKYELYGFTIAGYVLDDRYHSDDTSEIDLVIKNSYFEGTGAPEYILTVKNSKRIANTENRDSLTIENSYYLGKGSRTFLRNQGWADMTFDGLYADFSEQYLTKTEKQNKLDENGQPIPVIDEETGEQKIDDKGNPVYEQENVVKEDTENATRYFQQVYNEFSLTFKNSFFTGGTDKAQTYFEGYNSLKGADGEAIGEGSKKYIFDNNIFVNYDFGGAEFIPVKPQFINEFSFTNNYVNNEGKNYNFMVTATKENDVIDSADLKLDISNNTLIGFNGKVGASVRNCTSDSQIANNYTASSADEMGKFFNGVSNVVGGDYYLDPAKEILASDLTIKEWSGAELSVVGNKFTAVYTAPKFDESNIVYNTDKDVTTTWYVDKALTEEVEDINAVSGTVYLKLSATNSEGFEVYNVYDVVIIVETDNMFVDVYEAPATDAIKTKIDASKAFLVDFGSNGAGYGSLYTTTWQGVEYDFLKGINVFATIAELNTYLATANVEFPHILLKTISSDATGEPDINDYGTKGIREWQIKYHGAYYTENYNIVPYVVAQDGTWSVNPAYELANGIVARWIKPTPNMAYGTIELYGFAVTGAFQNSCGKGDALGAVDMYIENGYAADPTNHKTEEYPFHSHSDYARTTGGEAVGSLYVKNSYVEANDQKRALVYPSDTAANLTLDGIFLDGKGLDDSDWDDDTNDTDKNVEAGVTFDEKPATHMHLLNSTITIKNSNLANFKQAMTFAVISGETDTTASKHAIVLENNIMRNVWFGQDAFIEIDGQYTDVSLVNNTIVNDINSELIKVVPHADYDDLDEDGFVREDEVFEEDATSATPLKITVEDNVLIGFENIHVTDRALDSASSLDNNMTALVDMGGKVLTFISGETVIKDANFRVDIEDTMAGNVVHAMTVNGEAFDEDGAVANVEVKYTETEIDLNKYLVNKYNVVEFYADAEMTQAIEDVTAIALDTAAIYLKVMAADGESDVQTRTIKFVVGEMPTPEIEKVSATLYNDISMNFKTLGTELYKDVYAVFEVCGKTYKVTEGTVDGDYIVYSFDGLAPHRMKDVIKATIYATVDEVADTSIATYETSMADYLYQIKETITDNETLTKLVVDTLNYGAAAQQYRGYNVENLANAGLTDAEKVIADVETEDNLNKEFMYVDEADKQTEWKSIGLYLDEAIDIKLGFDITDKDAATLSDLSLEVYDDYGYEEVLTDCFVYRDGKFQIYFDDFNVSQVDDVFYFTLMNGDTYVSDTVAYSVESYANKAITLGNENLQNIAKALMNYGRSARAYSESL